MSTEAGEGVGGEGDIAVSIEAGEGVGGGRGIQESGHSLVNR